MLNKPFGKAPGIPLLAALLSVALLLFLVAGCGSASDDDRSRSDSEDETDRARDGSSANRTIFSRSSGSPEEQSGDQDSEGRFPFGARPDSLSGAQPDPTVTPLPADGPASLLEAIQGPPCPRRQPQPAAMLPAAQTSPETDKEALLALFEATEGDSWDSSSTWAGFAPIEEWQGVTVDDAGRVIGLELSGLNGELPPELGNLTGLQTLSITSAQLAGELPPELGNLTGLQALSITKSQVAGALPPELGNLTGLKTLTITNSQVAGALPPELGRLTGLEELSLRQNQFCGEIPPELDGLTGLLTLDLEENQLTGELPEALASLEELETLNLARNQFTGEVPAWLARLSNLKTLDLSNNQLSGELPPELDELAPGLQELYLGRNQSLGCMSQFLDNNVSTFRQYEDSPPVCTPENHAGDTETLVALYRAWGEPGWENWLSREPISEWEGVYIDAEGRVAALTLGGRGLTGNLPPQLSNLAGLQLLNLAGNRFNGEIPPELPKLPKLKNLDLSLNPLGTFTSLSVGISHGCGVLQDGSVRCWGAGRFGQAAPPDGKFTSVSAGGTHTCGVRVDGSLECWGGKWHPTTGIIDAAIPPEGKFASVSANLVGHTDNDYEHHTCGVRPGGQVECWGGLLDMHLTPPDGEFVSISAGREHTCGVRPDGSVTCWGDLPTGIGQPDGEFASISAGAWHTCGVKTDGSVACWGGERRYGDGMVFAAIAPDGEFTSVSSGASTTCGLRRDGTVECWGYHTYYEVNAASPAGEFMMISQNCGLRRDGSVECWEHFDEPSPSGG